MGIEEICKDKVGKLRDVDRLKNYFASERSKVRKKDVLRVLSYLSEYDLVVYGGVLSYPELFGYEKDLRKPSNDIDCVVKDLDLIKGLNVTYIAEYDIGLLVVDGIPVSLNYKHIHDWEIKDWFVDEAIVKEGYGTFASPTNNSLLKLRRMHYSNGKFGKDYVDILSLLLGPVGINLPKLVARIESEITSDFGAMSALLSKLPTYIRNIPKQDRENARTLANCLVDLLIEKRR